MQRLAATFALRVFNKGWVSPERLQEGSSIQESTVYASEDFQNGLCALHSH